MGNSNAYIGVGSRSVMIGDMGAMPTAPKQRQIFEPSQDIEYWGVDNLEPQRLLEEAGKNSLLTSALEWQVKALYSGGLQYGYAEADGEGGEDLIPQRIPEIDGLLKASNIAKQAIIGLKSFKILGNAFPEYILTKDRKKIAMMTFRDASYCRWGKYSERSGFKNCIINPSWELDFGTYDPKYSAKVPTIQRDGMGCEVDWMRQAEGHKFILPGVHWPTLGRSYYAKPQWSAILDTGWLSYANQIPKFKEAYLKNASHIKYAVHVPESWWKWKYPKWDSMTPKERVEKRKLEHDRFDKFLTGVENAGKSLMMTFRDDPAFQQQGYTKWEIQVIDKKVIAGILTDDVMEATQIVHNSVGVHGTLMGGTPGSKMGAGSGSDQKQAYNIFMALSQADQDILLRPLEIAAEYNGFKDLRFNFRNRLIADLKDVTPSKRNAQDAI